MQVTLANLLAAQSLRAAHKPPPAPHLAAVQEQTKTEFAPLQLNKTATHRPAAGAEFRAPAGAPLGSRIDISV